MNASIGKKMLIGKLREMEVMKTYNTKIKGQIGWVKMKNNSINCCKFDPWLLSIVRLPAKNIAFMYAEWKWWLLCVASSNFAYNRDDDVDDESK